MSQQAMILAAGRGSRLDPITRDCPKPLIPVAGQPLIERLIQQLSQVGVRYIVINLHYQGEMIARTLGDGARWGVQLQYSYETDLLDTGGAVVQAQSLLLPQPFWLISADIVTDFNFIPPSLETSLGCSWLVPKTTIKGAAGDFDLKDGQLTLADTPSYVYANIGYYCPSLFTGYEVAVKPLRDFLIPAVQQQQLQAKILSGLWYNVGTFDILHQVEQELTQR